MKERPKLGDKVYFYPRRRDGSMREGIVVCIFTTSNSESEQFVMEIPTHIEPIYEVRD